MNGYASTLRRAVLSRPALVPNTVLRTPAPRQTPRALTRYASSSPRRNQRRGGSGARTLGLVTFFAITAGAFYLYSPSLFPGTDAPTVEKPKYQKAEIEYEQALHQQGKPLTKDENRDLLSSQHVQVKQSWENPGVYAWGSNAGKVVDQDSKESYVKLPRRIPYFDGQILRDIKLTQGFGVAVTKKGDVVQWGAGFSPENPKPVETLKGKDISKIAVSDDRVIALSSNGTVYAIPASKGHQDDTTNVTHSSSSSWIPFWGSGNGTLSSSSIRNLTPSNLGWGEHITDISSGLQHSLLLTSRGRVYSLASSTAEFPSKGQLGVPGLTWSTRPKGAFDQAHELLSLRGFRIKQIATGDLHSAVLDKEGKIFTFGDNTYGQLGIGSESSFRSVDVPTLLPTSQLYANTGLEPKVTSIAAGGLNTFFTVDARRPANQAAAEAAENQAVAPSRRMPPVTSDTWACGSGIYGTLGTGRWTHVSDGALKIKSLSSLFEFDEKRNEMEPIRVSAVSVGSTHAAATMANETSTAAAGRSGTENDINWGADVLFWGGNQCYQLGTGKRSNVNAPTYIGALAPPAPGGADDSSAGGFHRLQLTPRKTVRMGEDGKGRKATLEQKVECGRYVTAVYSAA